MMVMSVDPARMGEEELPADERERLTSLARQFSREDLMRAFDLLSTAEQDIRTVSHPRYYFEMVLLRWMHLRKLVPLTELLEQLGSGGTKTAAPASNRVAPASNKVAPASDKLTPTSSKAAPTSERIAAPTSRKIAPAGDGIAPASDKPKGRRVVATMHCMKE